ncbi:MAG TPA: ABC transporter permease [Terriglobia bacterium]|nr:ABC transporter permease [Terriglobia bacterium]
MPESAVAQGWSPRRIPGVAYALVGLGMFFSIFARGFLSAPNLVNVGAQSAILLIVALPMTLIIMAEGLDLSAGAVLGLSGVTLSLALVQGAPLPVAFLLALAVGSTFGAINGLLVAVADIPPFVATLGTMGVAEGLAVALTDGRSVVGIGSTLPALYAGKFIGAPFAVWAAVLTYAVFHVLLYRTRFGAYVFALGGNREALVLAGLGANRYHILVYVLGGLLSGFGALLLTGRMSAGHPTAAIGMEFDAIAAVIVGGTRFERGNGWLPGTALGVITVGILKNGLNVMAVSSSLQVASIGVLVIAALLVDSIRERR